MEQRTYYDEDVVNRHPDHIPLAEGWDWYEFKNGIYSVRWLKHETPERTVYRCTHCGMESESMYTIRNHNRGRYTKAKRA